jgi:hypothetical protein
VAVTLFDDTGVLLIDSEGHSGTYARVAVTPKVGRHRLPSMGAEGHSIEIVNENDLYRLL